MSGPDNDGNTTSPVQEQDNSTPFVISSIASQPARRSKEDPFGSPDPGNSSQSTQQQIERIQGQRSSMERRIETLEKTTNEIRAAMGMMAIAVVLLKVVEGLEWLRDGRVEG
jgi:cystathionine beta-lyase/cystathionine gamma-synthase